ncbi:MAG: GAF domain-containing protein, partial [Burkholderiales bacterium]
KLARDYLNGAAILDARLIDLPDAELARDGPFAAGVANFLASGNRAMTVMPMLRGDTAIGAIGVTRRVPGPLSEKQLALLQTFADQAVIAIENVRLFNETREALERQTATAEILKVIASSPSDVHPVFDAIAQNAVGLCEGTFGCVFRYDGGLLHFASGYNLVPRVLDEMRARFPMRPDHSLVSGRAILSRSVAYMEDAFSDPDHDNRFAIAGGWRRLLGVPMLREGDPIGVIFVAWAEPGPIPKVQQELVKTFADQAVIAIENVRLFNETKEALERQTATAEILKVIASSPSDVQPVFDTIARSAVRLCGSLYALVFRFDGELIHFSGSHHVAPDQVDALKRGYPRRPDKSRAVGRAILSKAVVRIENVLADPDYDSPAVVSANWRRLLAIPILREGDVLGAITVGWTEPGPVPKVQEELLKTFADQAVIAIENVRLFNETKEALERQTATAEILKVISASPRDLQPVFDAILEKAMHLCEAHLGFLGLYDGERYEHVAERGSSPEFAKWIARGPFVPDPRMVLAQALRERKPVHHDDLRDSPGYRGGVEPMVKTVEIGGARTILAVPMLKGERAVGGIIIYRPEVRPFTQKQIDLVGTFASQAVIAIENVRLFKELETRTEALTRSVGQLTALGEVGQAISSTLDLETVLKTIVARAVQLTGLDAGAIYEYDERAEEFRLRAAEKLSEEIVEVLRSNPIRKGDGAVGGTAVTREPIQVPETQDESYQSRLRELVIRTGRRALLAVPLLREDHIIGALAVQRNTPGPFAPEIVELLKTFATQSAMAIQNARLFREIAEKGKQLEVASQHKSQFLASMSHELRTPLNAILGFNEMILDQVYGEVSADVRA